MHYMHRILSQSEVSNRGGNGAVQPRRPQRRVRVVNLTGVCLCVCVAGGGSACTDIEDKPMPRVGIPFFCLSENQEKLSENTSLGNLATNARRKYVQRGTVANLE